MDDDIAGSVLRRHEGHAEVQAVITSWAALTRRES